MKFDYYVIENLYSQEECQNIIQLIKNVSDPKLHDNPATGAVKTPKVFCATYDKLESVLTKLDQAVRGINKQFFGLHLFETSMYDVVNLNHYSAQNNSEYGWHKDGVFNECYDTKLTALINLSYSEYQGGEFELFLTGGPFRLSNFDSPGSVCVFPSWIYHRVLPIKQNERYSLVRFYTGPNLR